MSTQAYRNSHPEQEKAAGRAYYKNNPERGSVASHRNSILNPNSQCYANYGDMPFFDGWNPAKGGSVKVGGDWIIKHLGKRPAGGSIHIIDHEKGFVPGNLEWAFKNKQTNQQMFKIIAQQRHRIKILEERVRELEAL
jgi:hypothetical protein